MTADPLESVLGFILNRDSRPDRWAHMRQYEQLGALRVQRFAAVVPESVEAAARHCALRARGELRHGRRVHEGVQSKGAVGCSLSHISMWTAFLKSDKAWLLVLEDDVEGGQDLAGAARGLLRRGADWDVALMGWVRPFASDLVRTPRGHAVPWPATSGWFGTHAYLLSRRAAEVYVRDALPIQMQVDFYMQASALDHGLRIATVEPHRRLRQLGTLGSDIGQFCLWCEPLWIKVAFAISVLVTAVLTYLLTLRC